MCVRKEKIRKKTTKTGINVNPERSSRFQKNIVTLVKVSRKCFNYNMYTYKEEAKYMYHTF